MLRSYAFSRRQFLAGLLSTGVVLGCAPPAMAALHRPLDQPFDATTEAALNAALDRAFAQLRAPGVIVGVWKGPKAWVATRGASERNGSVKPTLRDHTRIGSITKTMVGTLVLQLVDEGVLGIDEPVKRFFPEMPDGDKITIRMLGTMSSGIASYTLDDDWSNDYFAHPTKIWKPEQLVSAALSLDRVFAPGEGFQYCNTNFVMLGMIVERLREKPLSEVLQSQIFQPLEMTRTNYPSDNAIPEPYWHGYTLQGVDGDQPVDATAWSPTFGAGAGQVISVLHDLRLWSHELGTGGLLKPDTQLLRLRPNTHSTKGDSSYAFAVGTDNGWIAHAGELPGFNTQAAYLPALGITIAVMANSDIPGANKVAPAVEVFNTLTTVISPDHLPQILHKS